MKLPLKLVISNGDEAFFWILNIRQSSYSEKKILLLLDITY